MCSKGGKATLVIKLVIVQSSYDAIKDVIVKETAHTVASSKERL
jgi:hypothetical protein